MSTANWPRAYEKTTCEEGDKIYVDLGGCRIVEAVVNANIQGELSISYIDPENGHNTGGWCIPRDIVDPDALRAANKLVNGD